MNLSFCSMLARITLLGFPVLMIVAVCSDPSLRLRVVRALGPLYVVSETPELRPVPAPAAPRYEPCIAGCCDDDPAFCALLDTQSPFGSMENACGYATVRSRCVKSCGRCDAQEDTCEDEWPRCDASLATDPDFCKLDYGASKCRRSCGLCARPACSDSLTFAEKCARAKSDLRLCAKEDVAAQCMQTCGRCGTPVSLRELLRRQPCVDAPGCELSDDEVADQTLEKFRNCEDITDCSLSKRFPTKEALCADPMFAQTLCRGTCGNCTKQPPIEKRFLAETRRADPATCPAYKARQCPKKCGVCKPDGKRSIWQVSDVERLVPQLPPKPADPQHSRSQRPQGSIAKQQIKY